MNDLVERLNEEVLGFGIGPALLCQEAAAEITRLRAALADAHAVGFAAGVEAADWEIFQCMGGHEKALYLGSKTPEIDRGCIDALAVARTSLNGLIEVPDIAAAAARVLLDAAEQSETFTDEFKETVRRVVRGFEGENA